MQNDNQAPQWTTLVWLGVLCGISLGALAVILFRRSDRLLAAPIDQQPQQLAGLGDWQMPKSLMTMAPATPRRKTVARSAIISTSVPTELCRATGSRDWSITVRTVGPPGSFAMFSCGNNPGESISVPAGSYQTMYLQSGETLYAQGDTPNVEVSVSGGET